MRTQWPAPLQPALPLLRMIVIDYDSTTGPSKHRFDRLVGGLGLDFDKLGFYCEEGVNDDGVKVRASAFDDDGAGRDVSKGAFVNATGNEGVVDIGEGDDSA